MRPNNGDVISRHDVHNALVLKSGGSDSTPMMIEARTFSTSSSSSMNEHQRFTRVDSGQFAHLDTYTNDVFAIFVQLTY